MKRLLLVIALLAAMLLACDKAEPLTTKPTPDYSISETPEIYYTPIPAPTRATE